MGIFDWLFGKNEKASKPKNKLKVNSKKKTTTKPKKKVTTKPKKKDYLSKKLTSYADIDVDMLMVAEYRIKVLRELFGIDVDENHDMHEHFRRIINLWRQSPRDEWDKISKDYFDNIPKLSEIDKKRQDIFKIIVKEQDLLKQNMLIDKELDKDPKFLELYNIKAYNLYELGNVKLGIKTILTAIKIDPSKAAYYDTVGEGYVMLKEYNKAVQMMTKGINLAPDGLCADGTSVRIADHYYNRGMAFLKLEKFDKAKKDFLHTLVIDVGYEKAVYALKEIPGYLDD